MRTECECAGTGRQARLRGVCRSTYGFKSRLSHQEKTLTDVCPQGLFFFVCLAESFACA